MIRSTCCSEKKGCSSNFSDGVNSPEEAIGFELEHDPKNRNKDKKIRILSVITKITKMVVFILMTIEVLIELKLYFLFDYGIYSDLKQYI